jgi:hypothetical protein
VIEKELSVDCPKHNLAAWSSVSIASFRGGCIQHSGAAINIASKTYQATGNYKNYLKDVSIFLCLNKSLYKVGHNHNYSSIIVVVSSKGCDDYDGVDNYDGDDDGKPLPICRQI